MGTDWARLMRLSMRWEKCHSNICLQFPTRHTSLRVYGWYEEINNCTANTTMKSPIAQEPIEVIRHMLKRSIRESIAELAREKLQIIGLNSWALCVRNRKKNSNSSYVRALDICGLLSQSFNFDTINYSYSVIYWIVLHIKVDMSMWKGELDCW